MSDPQPVDEQPCKVKIRPSIPVVPGKTGCRSCHTHDTPTITEPIEQPMLLKSTYYSRLKEKYFLGQEFDRSKEKKPLKSFDFYRDECLKRGVLFVDDEFPPISNSITFNGVTERQYEWKRPSELVSDPRFFVEGATRFDIQQGELGGCWLLAAVSCLTMNPRLFHLVVPCDQSFHMKYAGIFHFRFWQYGKWEDVIIDDLLPSYRGRLCFMHSKTSNEFWCALLEKAYAKMYGGYEALRGGNISESMVDLTGGVVENINLREPHKYLYTKMKRACKREAMMGCGIEPDDPSFPCEGRLSNGLIASHAYSITRVRRVNYFGSRVELLRLHNPWGNEAEWKGAWSDQSPEWKSVSEEERNELGLTFDDDGEFWMPYKDFLDNFTTLDICEITPEVFNDVEEEDLEDDLIKEEVIKRQWKMKMYEDEWLPGMTAGGCRNFLDTFVKNPQKIVLLDIPDKGTEECVLVVSLMQKYVRQKKRWGIDFAPIGFVIYRLPPGVVPGKPLSTDFFRYNASCGKSSYFLNTREVSNHFRFPPGVYVVIPSTFEPHCKAQFLLRLFTESQRS